MMEGKGVFGKCGFKVNSCYQNWYREIYGLFYEK